MKLEDILSLDGIVIRHIPKTSKARYVYKDELKEKYPDSVVINDGLNTWIDVTVHNKFHGYLITFYKGTAARVTFSLKHDGHGQTIEEAYLDYLAKADKFYKSF